jgi:nicotinamide phosphoribosyltransferase
MLFPFVSKSDSYKYSHYRQYPPGTTQVSSYFESRGGVFEATTFFGLQMLLKAHFVGRVVTQRSIEEVDMLCKEHFGTDTLFNRTGFEHILREHDGKLPLSIRAVAEGSVIPTSNVLMTVENTCPECFWLTNFVETLLVQTWYPTTVATQSREIRKLILGYLEKTGDPAGIDFKLHDFGFRGVSSVESAAIGGLAHLVNFKGTDTFVALLAAMDYYNAPGAVGHSIPAAEHSTITSWGRNSETSACLNMLTQYPGGLVAVVSDSYDIDNCVQNIWGKTLKDAVLAREGCLVVRPDSGYPPHVVYSVIHDLGVAYGYTTNNKGYKVLHPKVRVIQGDGVDYDMIDKILDGLEMSGWSADNIAFGMGGALLQKLDRDTQKFAFKCSYVSGAYGERDVFKQPIGDATKRSKAGKQALIYSFKREQYETVRLDSLDWQSVPGRPLCSDPLDENLLREVFRDGELLIDTTFDDVRSRALNAKAND